MFLPFKNVIRDNTEFLLRISEGSTGMFDILLFPFAFDIPNMRKIVEANQGWEGGQCALITHQNGAGGRPKMEPLGTQNQRLGQGATT